MNETIVPPGWTNLPMYILYMIEGFPTVVGNLLISLSILRYRALRANKEYTIMLGLALADCINMAGNFSGGLYRTHLVLSYAHSRQMTAWECSITAHNIFWSVGVPLSNMMLAVVSTDRLLCVLKPLSYMGWTVSYARTFVACPFLIAIAGSLYSYSCTYGSSALVAATCIPPQVYKQTTHRLYYVYFTGTAQFFAFLSVVIYGFVIVFYKRMNRVVCTEHPNEQFELKRQRKVTITLSISAVCTLFLFVIPFTVAMEIYKAGYFDIAMVLWCTSNLNPLANVFIYPLRHREIRQAVRALVCLEHMPADLKLWANRKEEPVAMKEMPKSQSRGKLVARNATVPGKRVLVRAIAEPSLKVNEVQACIGQEPQPVHEISSHHV